MADKQLTFDPKRVRVVPIAAVRPNPWNPKEHDPEGGDYRKVVKSVAANGLRQPIVVRHLQPSDGEVLYEVIDGEQRYRAAAELGYPKVVVYDEGEVPDAEAQALTIWYQQQVPFDEVMEARLAAALAQLEDIELPYTEDELERLVRLADFDFSDYISEEGDADVTHKHTIKLELTERQIETIRSALDAAKEEGSTSDAQTVTQWAIDYLEERGGSGQ